MTEILNDAALEQVAGGGVLDSVGGLVKRAGQEYCHYAAQAGGFITDLGGRYGSRDLKLRQVLPDFMDKLTGRN